MTVDADKTHGPTPESPQSWRSHILAYEEPVEGHPIPTSLRPREEDRQSFVPASVEEYLKWRYGPTVQVGIGSRFGKADGSGYSYYVYTSDNGQHTQIAKLEAVSTTISMLPPNYEGPLKQAFEEVQERNRFLTTDSRPEELVRTLPMISESPEARQMHQRQVDFFKDLKFEPVG